MVNTLHSTIPIISSARHSTFLLLATFCLGISSAHAERSEASGWWITGEAGATFAVRKEHTNTYGMPDGPSASIDDDYRTDDRDDSYLLGITAGYQFSHEDFMEEHPCCAKWLPASRLGLGYEFVGATRVKGQVIKYQEAPYDAYHYDVYADVIWLDGQLDLFNWNRFTPFIDAGIGIAFNHAAGYEEGRETRGDPLRRSADFTEKTTTQLAWRAGIGLNYILPKALDDWTLGILVRYSDLGEATTGDSETYPTVGELTAPLSNIELLLALRYDF